MAGAFNLAGLIVVTPAICIAALGLGRTTCLELTAPMVVLGITLIGLLTL